jgi:hypothetical protein
MDKTPQESHFSRKAQTPSFRIVDNAIMWMVEYRHIHFRSRRRVTQLSSAPRERKDLAHHHDSR